MRIFSKLDGTPYEVSDYASSRLHRLKVSRYPLGWPISFRADLLPSYTGSPPFPPIMLKSTSHKNMHLAWLIMAAIVV